MENYLSNIFRQYTGASREHLIPILMKIQEERGFIDEEAVAVTGEYLGISTARIYSLATFYDEFRFRRRGSNHFVVCCGATCWMRGSEMITRMIEDETGVLPGGVSTDSQWSLDLTGCRGACQKGPVVLYNGEPVLFEDGDDPVAGIRKFIKGIKNE
ncbi:MAG: NAD(P)H-dependent oxidoreductase subunit E [Bacteroidales bacterium]|nr:NAD(P)H-dependent oxidoreductase subunit E [Bacteroidales bacterium]